MPFYCAGAASRPTWKVAKRHGHFSFRANAHHVSSCGRLQQASRRLPRPTLPTLPEPYPPKPAGSIVSAAAACRCGAAACAILSATLCRPAALFQLPRDALRRPSGEPAALFQLLPRLQLRFSCYGVKQPQKPRAQHVARSILSAASPPAAALSQLPANSFSVPSAACSQLRFNKIRGKRSLQVGLRRQHSWRQQRTTQHP